MSLSWVRHLALQILQQSPHLLTAAKAALSTLNPDEEIPSSTTNNRPSSSTQNTEAGRKARNLLRERGAETEALLRNTLVDRFGVMVSVLSLLYSTFYLKNSVARILYS